MTDTSQPSTASPASKAVDFPPEIWLEVFSNLNYSSLKTLQSVSRSFKRLLVRSPDAKESHTAIDRILFRDFPVELPKEEALKPQFELHPVLRDDMEVTNVTYDDEIGVCVHVRVKERLRHEEEEEEVDGKYGGELLFANYYMDAARSKLPFMRENVTSPATRYMHLEVRVEGIRGAARSLCGPDDPEKGIDRAENVATVIARRAMALYKLVARNGRTLPAAGTAAPAPAAGVVTSAVRMSIVPPSVDAHARNDLVGMFKWLVARGTLVKKGLEEDEIPEWRERILERFGEINGMPNEDAASLTSEQIGAVLELLPLREGSSPCARAVH